MRSLAVHQIVVRVAAAMTIAVAAVVASPAHAQSVDYTRADLIRTFDPLLVGGRVYPIWLRDSVRFYFEANGAGADRGTLYLVDPRARTKRPLLDNARIASSLSIAADTTVDPAPGYHPFAADHA
jgi:hypothetical protein